MMFFSLRYTLSMVTSLHLLETQETFILSLEMRGRDLKVNDLEVFNKYLDAATCTLLYLNEKRSNRLLSPCHWELPALPKLLLALISCLFGST